jgi:sortase A
LALSYCGVVLVQTWIFQKRASAEFERKLDAERTAREGSSRSATPGAPVAPPAIAADGLIGRIAIKRLSLSAVIFEGTDKATLRKAVGHITSTALPGQPGNVGIAGHRDTFFRPLRNIQTYDVITLTTFSGEFRYRVVSTRVVPPTEVSVLDPDETEVLTLVTCYPFYFVGSAPSRFIVRAERIE